MTPMVPRRHALQWALLRSLLTHLGMHTYLVTSHCACLPTVPRPSSHPYINPDSTRTSCWLFIAFLVLFLSCVLDLLLFRLRAFLRDHTTRPSYTSTLYPRSSSSLTCAALALDIGQVSHLVPCPKSSNSSKSASSTL